MSSNFSQGQIEISKQQEPPKLGIGLVTYNRLEHLKNCIECIRQFTTIPYYLVIADDGSSDGSVEWCHSQALAVITGDNRGVVWNKNRALFALVQYTSAESFVLLEDDCWPASETWAQEWHETTQLWHHINFAHPQTILARPGAILSGRGTAEKPYISGLVTGQCTGCSRHAVKQVGYLDTRFRGYGHGHVEWTRRFLRAGLGKAESLDEAKKSDRLVYLCITGGLEPHDAPTHRTTKELEYNSKIFKEIVNEPVYREPWKNDEEKNLLIREVNHLEGKTSQLECVASIKQAQKPKGDNQLNPQLINTVVRVTEVIKLVKKGTDLVLGYSIDRPQRNLELDMESLKISGWVVGTNTQAISVEFICNGEVICKAATNQHRPDVGKVYPQKSESENSGFSAIILLGQIPLEVGLLIQVILADQKRVPISLITFEKSSDSKVGNTLQPSIVSPQQASLSASSKENVIKLSCSTVFTPTTSSSTAE
ncbi:MAG: glycosyltransferase [Oscillatoriales cyanobacterium SM2_3_0]|nr:glycosyltransferase [Oscillatoriales cyanobacterium SM2_3_0]